MALTYDNIIALEGSAKLRKIISLEFVKAFQMLHRNVPIQKEGESVQDFNLRVDNYLNVISVKPEMERQIEPDGKLNIKGTAHLLIAISGYDIAQSDDIDELINNVLSHKVDNKNTLQLECTTLLKAYSFKPSKI